MEQQGQNNNKVVQHLVELIQNELDNKSSLKGLENVELLSYYLRSNSFNFKEFLQDDRLKAKIDTPKKYTNYCEDLAGLEQRLKRISKGKAFLMPDIMQEYHALRLAGISVGETNCINLGNAIKALAIENDAKEIRFWGKILGHRDYYVIQGVSSKKYLDDELGPDGEAYGAGVNSYSYWVSTNILGNWVELPLVTPSQVKDSRRFKYIFSGELEKDLSFSKYFNGKEKHLLKCVIARITHSCQLVPKGLLKPNDENPNVLQFEEEFKTPQIPEMNSLQNWVHLNPHILNQGRISYYIDPKLSEEQKEALNTELGEKDPMVQRLKGITEDKPNEALGYQSAWMNQIYGETVPINLIGKQEGQSAIYGVAALRNLSWPGAYTVGYKGGWTNIYIGYGQRISQENVLVKELNDLAIEGQDQEEKSEPNPAKAPEPPKEEPAEGQEKPAEEDPPAE